MDGARASRRLTGWLALVALALQLAVSFAHVHREDFAGLFAAGITQAAATQDTPDGQPDPDHLTCNICATVHLAGTTTVPAPPVLLLPAFLTAALTIAAPPACATALLTAFHARGPPQA